jgi:hypothetical protein
MSASDSNKFKKEVMMYCREFEEINKDEAIVAICNLHQISISAVEDVDCFKDRVEYFVSGANKYMTMSRKQVNRWQVAR